MFRTFSRPASLAAIFLLAACSGGGMMSSTPTAQSGSAQSAQSQTQTQERSTLSAPAKPKKNPPCPNDKKDFDYCLGDDATFVSPGNHSPTAVQEMWGGTAQCVYPNTPPKGGDTCDGFVAFGVPAGFTVSQLNTLSADFKVTRGTCSQGSPRFQIEVKDGTKTGNVFVYFGPQFPNTGAPPCSSTYANSGNMLAAPYEADATQLGAGYEPWATFQATHGSDPILAISLVTDGYIEPLGSCTAGSPGCYMAPDPGNYITAQFDNVKINSQTFGFESAKTCEHGGWQQYTGSPGPFANQDACQDYYQAAGDGDGDKDDNTHR